jgi:hypothetical protein
MFLSPSDGRLHEVASFRVDFGAGARAGIVVLVPARCLRYVVGVVEDASDGCHRGEADSLADSLELEAIRVLAQEFRIWTAPATVERVTTPVAATMRECATGRYASALVSLDDCKYPLVMLLSPAALSAMLPSGVTSAAPEAERIESRRDGLHEQLLEVEAMLGQIEVSLGELAGLAVGDVIVLDESLARPASLRVRGGGHIVAAFPGRSDGKRAIQVTGE